MVTLERLLANFTPAQQSVLSAVCGKVLSCPFADIKLDSRQVAQGDLFVLLSAVGTPRQTAITNAKGYLESVKDKVAFVISEFGDDELGVDIGVPVISVPQIREYLGDLVKWHLQSKKQVSLPKVVAVTGTNGKTTVSQLIAQLAELSGVPSAVMGTAGNGRLGQLVQSSNTTGDVLSVHQFLYQMGEEGVALVALEASSHGLHQHRLQGVPIVAAVYTNLSHDHLDYHADMQDYLSAKARLFDKSYFDTLAYGVVNADAQYPIIKPSQDLGFVLQNYSQQDDNVAYFAKEVEPSLTGVNINLQTPHGDIKLNSPLLGMFNVDNLMAAVSAFLALYPQQASQLPSLVARLQGACGRMQRVPSSIGSFIVDYAHTPDALEQVLLSLRKHCTGRLIAVFGCGGDRDKTKRPIMAKAGVKHADFVILTADNPRSEDPKAILADMQVGLSCDEHYKLEIEPDRKRAIELAVQMAKADDIVVIAGKGHETYQEINGVRHDFDDGAITQQALHKYHKASS